MRADRLLAILLLLQTRGRMTGEELATRLEVSRRTILRDIDALSAAGIPIYAQGGHGGGFALDEDYRTTLTGMQDKEIRTLFINDNRSLLSELGFGAAAESALLKLRAGLPTAHQAAVEHIRQRILIDPAWWWHDAQPQSEWEQLQRAVLEDRCVRVIYEQPHGELSERVLEPYSLVAKSSVWYLIAQFAGSLHTYRVLRFREVELLDTFFQRRADFDLPAFWQTQLQHFEKLVSGYTFTLRVDPDWLNFVKTIVPGRYQPVDLPGAEGWLTLQFQLESFDLAKMLVFGLGEHTAVVEPAELKRAVLESARALLHPRAGGPPGEPADIPE